MWTGLIFCMRDGLSVQQEEKIFFEPTCVECSSLYKDKFYHDNGTWQFSDFEVRGFL